MCHESRCDLNGAPGRISLGLHEILAGWHLLEGESAFTHKHVPSTKSQFHANNCSETLILCGFIEGERLGPHTLVL